MSTARFGLRKEPADVIAAGETGVGFKGNEEANSEEDACEEDREAMFKTPGIAVLQKLGLRLLTESGIVGSRRRTESILGKKSMFQ